METEDFMAELTRVDIIRRARDEAVRELGDDLPVTLFGRLGLAIAGNFEKLSPEERTHVFNVIESGMDESNDALRTCVATGLLEALWNKTQIPSVSAQGICSQLGKASREYLMARDRFYGISWDST